jgi:hypothetical protein
MSNQWYDIDAWQWTDNVSAEWGFAETTPSGIYEGLYQIWTDDQYVYAATSSGLDVISIETEERVSFATNPEGYTCVSSDSEKIYAGSKYGIKCIDKEDVGHSELAYYTNDYQRYPFLNSDEVFYLYGNENKLICSTIEGINIIRKDSGYITKTSVSGAKKCFVTPNYDYYYYTVSGTSNWQLCRLNGNTSDWADSDIVYTTGSGFLHSATCLNDFYVTEHTSISGVNNTLFVATDIGIYVYDEGSGDYAVFTTIS